MPSTGRFGSAWASIRYDACSPRIPAARRSLSGSINDLGALWVTWVVAEIWLGSMASCLPIRSRSASLVITLASGSVRSVIASRSL